MYSHVYTATEKMCFEDITTVGKRPINGRVVGGMNGDKIRHALSSTILIYRILVDRRNNLNNKCTDAIRFVVNVMQLLKLWFDYLLSSWLTRAGTPYFIFRGTS